MTIEWRQEMSIDGGLIDHDHQVLIGVINEFCTPSPTGEEFTKMQTVLGELSEYTCTHFAREEKLQVQVRYPYESAHHREHQELIRKLDQIREMVDAAAISEDTHDVSEVSVLRAKITGLLHDWLIDHILKSDLRMKPYAKSIGHFARDLEPLHIALKR